MQTTRRRFLQTRRAVLLTVGGSAFRGLHSLFRRFLFKFITGHLLEWAPPLGVLSALYTHCVSAFVLLSFNAEK